MHTQPHNNNRDKCFFVWWPEPNLCQGITLTALCGWLLWTCIILKCDIHSFLALKQCKNFYLNSYCGKNSIIISLHKNFNTMFNNNIAFRSIQQHGVYWKIFNLYAIWCYINVLKITSLVLCLLARIVQCDRSNGYISSISFIIIGYFIQHRFREKSSLL